MANGKMGNGKMENGKVDRHHCGVSTNVNKFPVDFLSGFPREISSKLCKIFQDIYSQLNIHSG